MSVKAPGTSMPHNQYLFVLSFLLFFFFFGSKCMGLFIHPPGVQPGLLFLLK